MYLAVMFGKDDKLGNTIDLVRAACTIKPENPASVPVHDEGEYWYFSLQVELDFNQIKAALLNGATPLGPRPESLVGWDEQNIRGLFLQNGIYSIWSIDVTFTHKKMVAKVIGVPQGNFYTN